MTNIDTLLTVTEMKGTRISGGGGRQDIPLNADDKYFRAELITPNAPLEEKERM